MEGRTSGGNPRRWFSFGHDRRQKEVNLLELRPARTVEWERNENSRAVLLVPRFSRKNPVGRWLLERLREPFVRMHLDDYGSLVWSHCDGRTTIEEIGARMKATFGESAEPLYERIGLFIRRLERDGFICIDYSAARSPAAADGT